MQGFLKPRCGELPKQEARLYFHSYCGLCQHLREEYGLLARFLTNREALFLQLLYEAHQEEAPPVQMIRCPVMWQKHPARANPEAASFAAAVSVLLFWVKLTDTLEDYKGFFRPFVRILGKACLWLTRKKIQKSEKKLNDLQFQTHRLFAIFEEQQRLEAKKTLSMEESSQPSAHSLATLSAHIAIMAGRPDLQNTYNQVGEALGRLIYLLDAKQDLPKDKKRGEFNAILADPDANHTPTHARTQEECRTVLPRPSLRRFGAPSSRPLSFNLRDNPTDHTTPVYSCHTAPKQTADSYHCSIASDTANHPKLSFLLEHTYNDLATRFDSLPFLHHQHILRSLIHTTLRRWIFPSTLPRFKSPKRYFPDLAYGNCDCCNGCCDGCCNGCCENGCENGCCENCCEGDCTSNKSRSAPLTAKERREQRERKGRKEQKEQKGRKEQKERRRRKEQKERKERKQSRQEKLRLRQQQEKPPPQQKHSPTQELHPPQKESPKKKPQRKKQQPWQRAILLRKQQEQRIPWQEKRKEKKNIKKMLVFPEQYPNNTKESGVPPKKPQTNIQDDMVASNTSDRIGKDFSRSNDHSLSKSLFFLLLIILCYWIYWTLIGSR